LTFNFGGTETEEFFKLVPNQTVPIFADGQSPPNWETGCILRCLANRYGEGSFWPSDLPAGTEIDQSAEWSKVDITIVFTALNSGRSTEHPSETAILKQSEVRLPRLRKNWPLRNSVLPGMFSLSRTN
jgi:glutathione S-transferase